MTWGGVGTERPDMTWDTEIRKLLAGTIQLWENRDSAEIGGSEGHWTGQDNNVAVEDDGGKWSWPGTVMGSQK